MEIGFTKMHGLGNDFIVIDNFSGRIKLSKGQIFSLCDRHKGIGADGLILVEKSISFGEGKGEALDCFMNYYNADGTEAEMCGNGIRCTALFLKNYYLKDKKIFKIETRAGNKEVVYEKDGTFSVNMGKPIFSHQDFPKEKINQEGLGLDFVSMGNPHAVAFVENLEAFDLQKIGPLEIVEKNTQALPVYKVKVWERGCGATLACGTGACAVYAIVKKSLSKAELEKEIIIELPGGKLFIKENERGEIIMRGEAKGVFSGTFEID